MTYQERLDEILDSDADGKPLDMEHWSKQAIALEALCWELIEENKRLERTVLLTAYRTGGQPPEWALDWLAKEKP